MKLTNKDRAQVVRYTRLTDKERNDLRIFYQNEMSDEGDKQIFLLNAADECVNVQHVYDFDRMFSH